MVQSGGFGLIGLPPTVAEEIGQLPGIDFAAPARFAPAVVDGDDSGVAATNIGGLEVFDFQLEDLSPEMQAAVDAGDGNADIPEGQIVLTDDEARSAGLSSRTRFASGCGSPRTSTATSTACSTRSPWTSSGRPPQPTG